MYQAAGVTASLWHTGIETNTGELDEIKQTHHRLTLRFDEARHTPPAIDISPDPETAHRESGHERRENRAHRKDRIAEQQMEHARPHHFVEQPADAGQETDGQDDATPDPDEESRRENRHGSTKVLLHQDTSPSREHPAHTRALSRIGQL